MKLVEKTLPIEEINALAAHEMAFLKLLPRWVKEDVLSALNVKKEKVKAANLPKLHNLHYYPAREPLSVARLLNAAAALPEDVQPEELLRLVGVEELKGRIEAEGRLYGLFSVEPDREALRRGCAVYERGDLVVIERKPPQPPEPQQTTPEPATQLQPQRAAYDFDAALQAITEGAEVEVSFVVADLGVAAALLNAVKNNIKRLQVKSGGWTYTYVGS